MIEGFDISHWNGVDAVSDFMQANPETAFVVIKATQGTRYSDPTAMVHVKEAALNGLVYGLYHFADGGDALAEARHFVEKVEELTIGYVDSLPFLVLDWEGNALKRGATWAAEFCKEVIRLTGCKPLIYTSQSNVKKLKAVQELDCGLWVARWSASSPGDISPWSTWAMWQYKVGGYDYDRFNGSMEQLRKYCMERTSGIPSNDPCRCHCGCSGCECDGE